MDFAERVDFEHAADAQVLRFLVARPEQPAIDLLPLLAARREHLGQAGLRMLAQIAEQPQLERVNAGHVTTIGQ